MGESVDRPLFQVLPHSPTRPDIKMLIYRLALFFGPNLQVPELAGHSKLETISGYSLPTDTDEQDAINNMTIDY